MDSRAVRPYPPGDLKVDGVSYPEGDSDGVTDPGYDGVNELTWSHRDRLQQTDGNLYDYTEGNIGPEDGTTYLLQAEGYNSTGASTGVFIDKNVGLVTSYEFGSDDPEPPVGTAQVVVRVYSVRDGYRSWQPAKVILSLDGSNGGGDEYWAYVTLHLAFDDQPDESTTITDSSDDARSMSALGNSQIDTDDPIVGAGSLLCDGSGDQVVTANNSGLIDFSGPLTFRCWINADSLATRGIFGTRLLSGVNNYGIQWYIQSDGSVSANGYDASEVLAISTAAGVVSVGTDHFLELNRDASGDWRIFVDGNLEVTQSESGNISQGHTSIGLGVVPNAGAGTYYWFDGHIDDFQITNGVCRNTSSYSPPSGPLPTS